MGAAQNVPDKFTTPYSLFPGRWSSNYNPSLSSSVCQGTSRDTRLSRLRATTGRMGTADGTKQEKIRREQMKPEPDEGLIRTWQREIAAARNKIDSLTRRLRKER